MPAAGTNKGEVIVRKLLNEYSSESFVTNVNDSIAIFHDVEIAIPEKKYTAQYDHIVLSKEAIVVIETKYWNGNTFVITQSHEKGQDVNGQNYIKFLDKFLDGSNKMVYRNKKTNNDTIIVNVKPNNTAVGELSYDVNFYSKKSMLHQSREKSVLLKRMLCIDAPVHNVLVFVEDKGVKNVEFIGKNVKDFYSDIVTSDGLTNALDDYFGLNAEVNSSLYKYHLSKSEYQRACSMLAQYAENVYPSIDEKQFQAAYLLADDDERKLMDSIIAKYISNAE